MLLSIAAFVVAIDFLLVDLTHGWILLGLMFSSVLTFLVAPLAIFSTGFTTIRAALITFVAIAAGLSVWTGHGPAKARFRFAKQEFEQIVQGIDSIGEMQLPAWVGSIHVQEIKSLPSGEVRFWTSLHPYGNTGIVYSSGQSPVYGGLDFRLAKDWYFVSKD